MCHAAEMHSAVQRAPGIIAIAHQQAAVVAQKGPRMLLAAAGLIVEYDNRLLTVPAAPVNPHEGLGLRVPAILLENLHPGLVAVDQGLRPELLLQRLIQPQQMQIDRPDHPVGQCTAADADICARQRLLQTIQGGAVDIFVGKHQREGGWRGDAARQGLCRHRRDHDRRVQRSALAVAAGIFEPHMLQHHRLHLDMQLLADGLTHPVHPVPAARADLLVFG